MWVDVEWFEWIRNVGDLKRVSRGLKVIGEEI